MNLSIDSWVHLANNRAQKDGDVFLSDSYASMREPQDMYRALQYSYMKFFKMDMLCKWAWLGAEKLLSSEDGYVYEGIDKNNIAVVLMTGHGCIDVDKKYLATMQDIPSPALFVYTLPNIMLGEICIRHGFKGEQLCLVSKHFDAKELEFWVSDLLNNRGMDACLCGWVDAYENNKDVCLFWVTKQDNGDAFTMNRLNELYKQ